MTVPWLSVVIPTYNGEKYLETALNSVLMQAESGVECVVIDDGSTDRTIDIIRSYVGKLNIKFVECQHSGNWVANSNLGIKTASGQYLCFLHQDDFWLDGRLRCMRAIIDKSPGASLYLHAAKYADESGRIIGSWRCPLPAEPKLIDSSNMLDRLIVQNFIAINAPIFNRASAMQAGLLDEDLWYTADWKFWLNLAASGPSVYVPEELAAFRVHAASQTIRRSIQNDQFQKQMDLVLDDQLVRHPGLSQSTIRAARFSALINASLAAMMHGQQVRYFTVLKQCLSSGPLAWRKFLCYSTIFQRVLVRLKIKLR